MWSCPTSWLVTPIVICLVYWCCYSLRWCICHKVGRSTYPEWHKDRSVPEHADEDLVCMLSLCIPCKYSIFPEKLSQWGCGFFIRYVFLVVEAKLGIVRCSLEERFHVLDVFRSSCPTDGLYLLRICGHSSSLVHTTKPFDGRFAYGSLWRFESDVHLFCFLKCGM